MQTPAARVARARAEFDTEDAYLDTASMGLPPRAASVALEEAHAAWRCGRADAMGYDAPLERSRSLYAGLVGVEPADVAVASQASVFVGTVAASLPDGAEVLTAEGEFTSVTFPFHAQRRGRLRIREVRLDDLVASVTRSTYLVAVSAVQSSDGRLADLDGLVAACRATGTSILLDTTQAVGWLPVDAGRFTYTVCGGYKWLLAARGTAFLTVQPRAAGELTPVAAGWYAGADPWTSIYGTPLRLADTAKRFDVSPAWLSWVTQAPALELLDRVGRRTLHANALGLSRRFCEGVSVAPRDSAIVSLGIDDEAPRRLRAAGVRASMRAGRLRLAFHVCTTEDDVDRAVEALRGHVVDGEP